MILNEWNREFTLFTPSREDGVVSMNVWDSEGTGLSEWYRNTDIPPKAVFFPAIEEIFHFQKDKQGYRVELPPIDKQKRLIFGIRPCDANSLAILDKTFEDVHEDPYYLSKRENTVLVGLGCTQPYDSCFCTSLGNNPTDSSNVDLMLIDIGDEWLIDTVTDKGEALIRTSRGLKKVTEEDKSRAGETKGAAFNKITRQLANRDIDKKLRSIFEEQAFWEEVAAKCVSCGICTLLCPTCYCFDINDELDGDKGARFRNWDSCSFATYTRMPAENPRKEKWRRVRNRICHKYEFYPINFGVIACTGCGRCIRQCPVNWDITRILDKVQTKVQA